MRDFALLTIQKKLDKEKYPLYWSLYVADQEGESLESILKREGIDPAEFGKIRFVENVRGVFVEHASGNKNELATQQLRSEMNVASEWLMCFSFSEMSVIGLDMGVFEAEATVSDVLERLQWADISDSMFDLFIKRDSLMKWLKKYANPNDRIHLCSDWIFYHPEGKYDYYFVKNHINKKIIELRKSVTCHQWSNNPTVRPHQMTA